MLVAAGFTVVASDLRGYGDSDKPPSSLDHMTYSKRAMAADQVELMRHLGHDRFCLAGHDRGGRVAHRMALDYPAAVERLAVLDIAPTATMYARTDRAFATGYYHWFFLIQPAPLPEKLIGADPDFYLRIKLAAWGKSGLEIYSEEAIAEYCRSFRDPASISATVRTTEQQQASISFTTMPTAIAMSMHPCSRFGGRKASSAGFMMLSRLGARKPPM
jgi:haloacetate dehalogenase